MAAKATRRPGNLWLHGNVWWCRVRMEGEAKRVSTGATEEAEALACRRRDLFEELVRREKHRDLLLGVMAGRVTLAELYHHYHNETLDTLRAQATSTNLEPLVETWLGALAADEAVRADTRKEYRQKVRSLMPEKKPFYANDLTPERVRTWLRGLTKASGEPVSTTTRRHYFDALRAFVRWLVAERDVWKVSPLAGMDVPKLGKPRDRHLTYAELIACLDAVAEPAHRHMLTLIAGTGMELSAAERVVPRGIMKAEGDRAPAMWARGTKNGYRDRIVFVRQWAWNRVGAAMRSAIGAAPVFDCSAPALRESWYEAQRIALGFTEEQRHTIHDLRHTYCFMVLTGDDGEAVKDLQWCADQLGHADTIMVSRIYGRYRLAERRQLEEAGQAEAWERMVEDEMRMEINPERLQVVR